LESTVKNITAAGLTRLVKEHAAIQLIDVREEYEHNEFNIGGLLLPLGTIVQNIDLIEKEKPVILYCSKGVRSQIAIQRLEQKYPFGNLINLEGGMESWKKEFPC
jgi:rhodanese-related sulfurtransferase